MKIWLNLWKFSWRGEGRKKQHRKWPWGKLHKTDYIAGLFHKSWTKQNRITQVQDQSRFTSYVVLVLLSVLFENSINHVKQQGHINTSRHTRAVGLRNLLPINRLTTSEKKNVRCAKQNLRLFLMISSTWIKTSGCVICTDKNRVSETKNNKARCCCWFMMPSMFLEYIHHHHSIR